MLSPGGEPHTLELGHGLGLLQRALLPMRCYNCGGKYCTILLSPQKTTDFELRMVACQCHGNLPCTARRGVATCLARRGATFNGAWMSRRGAACHDAEPILSRGGKACPGAEPILSRRGAACPGAEPILSWRGAARHKPEQVFCKQRSFGKDLLIRSRAAGAANPRAPGAGPLGS